MNKSGWMLCPAAFFLVANLTVSPVKSLFFSRLIYFLFFISLFFFLRGFDLSKILKAVIGGVSFIIFIYGIFQKFVLFPLYLENFKVKDDFYSQAIIARIESGRIFSIFELPTLYAIICAVLVLFLFHYLLKEPKQNVKYKVLWALLLGLGVVNLVLTQSFGGIVYLSVGIIMYLTLSGVLKFKYLAPAIMLLSLFLSITIAFRFSEARNLEPITYRFSNWVQAARVIESSPFWGVGLGNYESRVSYFTRGSEAKSIYAHNFFLQFISETGIVVSLFLLFLLGLSWKKLKPRLPFEKEKILHISVFAILIVYSLIDIGFYFFAAAIAATIALSQVYPAERKRNFSLNLVVLLLMTTLLGAEGISENYRKEADFLTNQEQYIEAESSYRKSLIFNPFNARTYMSRAFLAITRENFGEAEKNLAEVLAVYPDSSFANYLKSKVELRRGRLLSAYYHASLAYRKNPVNSRYKKWYTAIKNNLESHMQGGAP